MQPQLIQICQYGTYLREKKIICKYFSSISSVLLNKKAFNYNTVQFIFKKNTWKFIKETRGSSLSYGFANLVILPEAERLSPHSHKSLNITADTGVVIWFFLIKI